MATSMKTHTRLSLSLTPVYSTNNKTEDGVSMMYNAKISVCDSVVYTVQDDQ